jgi:hypothetical protein
MDLFHGVGLRKTGFADVMVYFNSQPSSLDKNEII